MCKWFSSDPQGEAVQCGPLGSWAQCQLAFCVDKEHVKLVLDLRFRNLTNMYQAPSGDNMFSVCWQKAALECGMPRGRLVNPPRFWPSRDSTHLWLASTEHTTEGEAKDLELHRPGFNSWLCPLFSYVPPGSWLHCSGPVSSSVKWGYWYPCYRFFATRDYTTCSEKQRLWNSHSSFNHKPWSRKWPPSPVCLPGESHGQRSLVGYSLPGGHKESDTTERLTHFNHKTARTQISIANEQINCGVITHTNKKKWTTDTQSNTNESQNHDVKWKKPDKKGTCYMNLLI